MMIKLDIFGRLNIVTIYIGRVSTSISISNTF